MKKLLMVLAILCCSTVQAQQLPFGASEDYYIDLMKDYHQVICKWDNVCENGEITGYVKTIEIFPKDTALVFSSIFFISSTVEDQNDQLSVEYVVIDDEEIPLQVKTTGKSSLLGDTVHPFPLLEAAMNKWLRKTKPGTKCRKGRYFETPRMRGFSYGQRKGNIYKKLCLFLTRKDER